MSTLKNNNGNQLTQDVYRPDFHRGTLKPFAWKMSVYAPTLQVVL